MSATFHTTRPVDPLTAWKSTAPSASPPAWLNIRHGLTSFDPHTIGKSIPFAGFPISRHMARIWPWCWNTWVCVRRNT